MTVLHRIALGGLWLHDSDRDTIAVIKEYESLIQSRRYSDHSSWQGKFPVTALPDLMEATYATIDSDECYLVEYVHEVVEGFDRYVEAGGRSATALLHDRTLDKVWRWYNRKPGAVVKQLIESLTGGRAIAGLAFGTGDLLGEGITLERSYEDMGDVVREVLDTSGLGMKARLVGDAILIDVYGPTIVEHLIGDKWGNSASSSYVRDIAEWKNHAIVYGEESSAGTRWRIDVDARGDGDPLRELFVDARDLQRELPATGKTFTVSTNDTFTFSEAHGLEDGNVLVFTGLSGGAPLANGKGYYVRDAGTLQLKVSATEGGGVLDITSNGSGTVQAAVLSVSQYSSILTQRGLEKLAEQRLLEYADAGLLDKRNPGDVVTYDSERWSATLMVTESITTDEGGAVTYGVTVGDAPSTLKRFVRRA